jgi:hypothetical protein
MMVGLKAHPMCERTGDSFIRGTKFFSLSSFNLIEQGLGTGILIGTALGNVGGKTRKEIGASSPGFTNRTS